MLGPQTFIKPPWKRLIVVFVLASSLILIGSNYYDQLKSQIYPNSQMTTRFMKKYPRQEKDKERGEANMQQIGDIKRQNMDPLPAPSFNPKEISQICKRSADKEDLTCIPGFIPFEAKYVISPRYKMATCGIQKSMSTAMRGVMCYLFNEKRFKDAGRQILKECYDARFCANKNEYTSITQIRTKFKLKPDDWRLLMISRDPVDRFLSGFLDKCIRQPHGAGFCNGCRRNMTCFLVTEYNRIKRQIRVNEFPRTFDDRHFFPQTWRCNLDKERHRYHVLRYSSDASGSFLNELLAQLKAQKIPDEALKFIRDQLSEGRTVHSTVDSDARKFLEKRLRGSPFLMEYIVRMFYTDFQYFNYSLPSGFH